MEKEQYLLTYKLTTCSGTYNEHEIFTSAIKIINKTTTLRTNKAVTDCKIYKVIELSDQKFLEKTAIEQEIEILKEKLAKL